MRGSHMSAKMAQTFEFVDATKSDKKTTRKLIRSHVMKGKNIGKKYYRGSKSHLAHSEGLGSSSMDIKLLGFHDETGNSLAEQGYSLSYDDISNRLMSFSFPDELSTRSQGVISEFFQVVLDGVHPLSFVKALDFSRSYWIGILLMDRTMYHCTVAVMAEFNNFFYGKNNQSTAIPHLNEVIRLVNQKINTTEALSTSNIIAVNYLVLRELLCESQEPAEVHMKGLYKMVELRGGLSSITENNLVALKLVKTSLDYALHYGTSTFFYLDPMVDIFDAIALEGISLDADCIAHEKLGHIDPFLRQIVEDTIAITSLSNEKGFQLDTIAFQKFIVSLGCRSCRFRTLSESLLENRLESAYHIGVITFLATLFFQIGARRYLKYALVGSYLRDVIVRGLDEEHNDVMLWLLFIGGISVLEDSNPTWLRSKICQTALSMRLETWDEVHSCLTQFPWINSIYDRMGKRLWESAWHDPTRAEK